MVIDSPPNTKLNQLNSQLYQDSGDILPVDKNTNYFHFVNENHSYNNEIVNRIKYFM